MKRKARKRTLLRLVRRRVYSSRTSCSSGVRDASVVCVEEEGVNSGAVVEGVEAIAAGFEGNWY